jgi:hypothetical protein
MPVQKFSAMDPSGSWNMDARDQTAMWNADRGDRINMWQTNRMDQRSQDDWRKDVALKQLGLTEKGMNWNREDTAAERAAKYGFMGEELGLRRQSMESDNDYRKRMIALQESDPNRKMGSYALEKMKGRDTARSNLRTRIASGQGLENMDPQAAAYLRMVAETGDDDTLSAMLPQIAARPLEQKFRREDQRSAAAEDAAARLEAGQFTGEREAQVLRSQAQRGGMKDVAVGRGQMQAASNVTAQPEFGQAVETLRSQLRSIPDVYKMGTQEGAAVGAILTQAIEAQAGELARQFGTDPRQLAQLLYAEVSKGAPGQERGFWSGLGRGISEVATAGFAETQNEAAQRLLAERFAQ